MRKIYGSKFIYGSITSVPHAHLAICICDMRFSENKNGGRVNARLNNKNIFVK